MHVHYLFKDTPISSVKVVGFQWDPKSKPRGSTVSAEIRVRDVRLVFNSRQRETKGASLRHRVRAGSGAHPTSCTRDTGGSFPEGKMPMA